jgi:hypothetical protein
MPGDISPDSETGMGTEWLAENKEAACLWDIGHLIKNRVSLSLYLYI